MIPIGDTDVRGAHFPIVTVALIAINVVVFLYQVTLSLPALESFYMQYAVVPTEIMQGDALYTLLTAMFLHGGWLHLISNMLFLWVFGDNIEAVLGRAMYLGFYLAGGLFASAAHILLNPNSSIPSLGASGAIAAVLGAYILIFPRARVKLLVFLGVFARVTRVAAVFFLGVWIVIQIFSGIADLGATTAQTGGTAFWAHIGGFIFGVIVGLLLRGRASEVELERSL